jgi:XTP/dITP diphosphohydrolase
MAGTSRQFPRQFGGGQLVVASHNEGKVREITALLAPFELAVVSAETLGLAEPEETGTSFIENAELKARAAAVAADLPALADDSGLAVAALGGAPGIYSARWAGPTKDFATAMERIERDIAGQDDRSARPRHSAKWIPTPNMPSAIEPTPSAS